MRERQMVKYAGVSVMVTPASVHASRVVWIADYLGGRSTLDWITELACTPLPTDPPRVPYRWWYRFTRDRHTNRAARVAPWRYTR